MSTYLEHLEPATQREPADPRQVDAAVYQLQLAAK